MKYPINYILLVIFSTILLSACNESKKDEIETHYTIVHSSQTDSLQKAAIGMLQDSWRAVSGKIISADTNWPQGRIPIFVGRTMATAPLRDSIAQLPADAFVIAPCRKGILLAGANSKTDYYAISTFLEQYLGRFPIDEKDFYTPKKSHIQLNITEYKAYKPAFSFRRMLLPAQHDSSFRLWHKLESLHNWGLFVHTFHRLVPPDTYYDAHPEYFSLVGGRRLKDAQLCLSNQAVIQLLIDNLAQEMALQPHKKIWSVSQNDCYNPCECANCRALYKKYGSYSGAYVLMANKIARAFPDKIISTLAYQFTRQAPKNIKPDSNVNIMFCSIECNRSMPLAQDVRSQAFVQELKDWSALSQHIFVWDYVVQFKNYLCPFPNMHVLPANLQLFSQAHVEMMFEQGSNASWSDLVPLKQYLIAKLLWNPNANMDSLVDVFLPRYYGPAAPYVKSYYQRTQQRMQADADSVFLNIYGYPNDYAHSFLKPSYLKEYKQLMDEAEAAVATDSTYLSRVWKTRLAVDFAYLDVALNTPSATLSFFDSISPNKVQLKSDMMALLHTLAKHAALYPDVVINERQFLLPAYVKYVENKLERSLQQNKLKTAHIELLTPHSERYPVGGAQALSDGLLGDLDYHNNWLGFYGHDMVAKVSFDTLTSLSKLNIHCLKAVNSWVFLPTHIHIEALNSQGQWVSIAEQKNISTDRNYLVKSIPFYFDFTPIKTKQIRITAESMKKCPQWHRGYGHPSWIFVDEIIAE